MFWKTKSFPTDLYSIKVWMNGNCTVESNNDGVGYTLKERNQMVERLYHKKEGYIYLGKGRYVMINNISIVEWFYFKPWNEDSL